MPVNLRHRDFATLTDFSPTEIRFLLQLARDLKAAKYGRYEKPQLVGKNIALIFEKTSTRTRCAFEVAAHDQGAEVTYLGPHDSQIGHKESMKDTARVLSRFYDAIEFRGAGQEIVDALVRVRRCADLQRADRRDASDAVPGRRVDHAGARRTSPPARLPSATSATAASTRRIRY